MPWYRSGTDSYVRCVQIVVVRRRSGRPGRSRTGRRELPTDWGPSGRWFKSSRPDFIEFFARSDSPDLALGLSNAQWTSLGMLLVALAGWWLTIGRKGRRGRIRLRG